jgi:uncharacterized protein (TIGR03435 family)
MALEKQTRFSCAMMILLISAQALGQEFEVASIKPSPPVDYTAPGGRLYGCLGGPGSNDPGQIHCSHVSAITLVFVAYDLPAGRISGLDHSGSQPQFEIAAKVPHGATEEQVRLMWQNLLANRFKLAVHRETKEVPVYELVVAKGGFKAKEWVDHPANSAAAPWEPGKPLKRDEEGFPIVQPGRSSQMFRGGKAYLVAPAGTIHDLAEMLETRLALTIPGAPRPVIDATGLKGKYDLKLWWSPEADSNDSAEGPSMLSALDSQLGLKLQPKKSAPAEIIVVDRLEKNPTEN